MSIDVKRANSLIKELYREYLLEEGGTWKTPSNQEIVDLLTRNGYTRKEAEKLIREHTEQLLQPYFKIHPIIYRETWEPMDERTLNELEHLPTRMYQSADECDLADYYIDTLSPQIDRMVKENLRKYILEAPHDPTDKTEKLLRKICAEREKHFLARYTLLIELIRRGFTPPKSRGNSPEVREEIRTPPLRIIRQNKTVQADTTRSKPPTNQTSLPRGGKPRTHRRGRVARRRHPHLPPNPPKHPRTTGKKNHPDSQPRSQKRLRRERQIRNHTNRRPPRNLGPRSQRSPGRTATRQVRKPKRNKKRWVSGNLGNLQTGSPAGAKNPHPC
ncbi:MAG: hypothetical protein Q6352_018215 [Candidatus Freyrarchaeum guaymaensis]